MPPLTTDRVCRYMWQVPPGLWHLLKMKSLKIITQCSSECHCFPTGLVLLQCPFWHSEFPNVCTPGYWGPILLTPPLLFVDFVFFKPGKITYQYVLISKTHNTFTKLNHCFQSALEFFFKAQKASPKAAWIQWRNWGWLPWGLLAGGNSQDLSQWNIVPWNIKKDSMQSLLLKLFFPLHMRSWSCWGKTEKRIWNEMDKNLIIPNDLFSYKIMELCRSVWFL